MEKIDYVEPPSKRQRNDFYTPYLSSSIEYINSFKSRTSPESTSYSNQRIQNDSEFFGKFQNEQEQSFIPKVQSEFISTEPIKLENPYFLSRKESSQLYASNIISSTPSPSPTPSLAPSLETTAQILSLIGNNSDIYINDGSWRTNVIHPSTTLSSQSLISPLEYPSFPSSSSFVESSSKGFQHLSIVNTSHSANGQNNNQFLSSTASGNAPPLNIKSYPQHTSDETYNISNPYSGEPQFISTLQNQSIINKNFIKSKKNASKKKRDLSKEVQEKMDKLFEEAKTHKKRKTLYSHLASEPAPEIITIDGESKYRCALCQKIYGRKDSCRKHISSEIWEYPCSFCGIISATAQACMYHVMAKHLHMQVFDCPFCDKRFATHYALSNHQERTHTSNSSSSSNAIVGGVSNNSSNSNLSNDSTTPTIVSPPLPSTIRSLTEISTIPSASST